MKRVAESYAELKTPTPLRTHLSRCRNITTPGRRHERGFQGWLAAWHDLPLAHPNTSSEEDGECIAAGKSEDSYMRFTYPWETI